MAEESRCSVWGGPASLHHHMQRQRCENGEQPVSGGGAGTGKEPRGVERGRWRVTIWTLREVGLLRILGE
jgi:hypothetical protein